MESLAQLANKQIVKEEKVVHPLSILLVWTCQSV